MRNLTGTVNEGINMKHMSSRISAFFALALLSAGAFGGCANLIGSQSGGATPEAKAIDALQYIGPGLKEDYKARIAQASDTDKAVILEEATRISGIVGQRLTVFDIDVNAEPRTLELFEDGTLKASDKKLWGFVSYATHWRVGDRTIDMCEDESCAYYSSWTVSVDDTVSEDALMYTITLDTGDYPMSDPSERASKEFFAEVK